MPDVIIIGSGLNGLVAGAMLAKQRLATLILEQRPLAGGAAVTTELAPGFRVPQLSHVLGPVRRDVIRALGIDRARLEFMTLDPSLTTLGRDGGAIVFHPDPVLTAGAINRVSPRDAGRWREFLHSTLRISRLIGSLNRHPPPSIDGASAGELWALLQLGRQARGLGRQDLARLTRWLPTPVADLVGEWFESDLLKAALASRAVFGNLAGPRSAGTGAALLQRLAEDPAPVGSSVTVRGGPGALSAALCTIAEQAGARVRTDACVARVTAEDGRVTGVTLENGEEIAAHVVVSAVDPRRTFLNLVETDDLPPTFLERIRHYRARGVTAKVNLALSALPSFVALHGDAVPLRGRFLIAPDLEYLERAFDAAKYGDFSPAPWLELAIPSVADSSLAPDGGHVMSIYAQFAPRHLRGAEWADRRNALYQAVLQALSPHVPGLASLVVNHEVLTPEDLERGWGLSGGHIFHGEPTLDQSWMARPLLGWSQYRTPIEGLYLASAGTHPGGGLTGGPGFLAAQTIARDLKRKRPLGRT